MNKTFVVWVILIAFMALLVACGEQGPTAAAPSTATATFTQAPTPTIATGAPVLAPSPAPRPTPADTPEPPPTSQAIPTAPGPVEMHIVTAEGSVIKADDIQLTLEIPPDGLTEDIVVSITPVEPDEVPGLFGESENIGNAYRLEPSGLSFEKPVVVALRRRIRNK